jgi:hypothetical protein
LTSAREIGALRMLPKASAPLLLFGRGKWDKHSTTRDATASKVPSSPITENSMTEERKHAILFAATLLCARAEEHHQEMQTLMDTGPELSRRLFELLKKMRAATGDVYS